MIPCRLSYNPFSTTLTDTTSLDIFPDHAVLVWRTSVQRKEFWIFDSEIDVQKADPIGCTSKKCSPTGTKSGL